MLNSRPKQMIGRAEQVFLPEITADAVHARIDTGANTSAIWAAKAEIENGRLAVVFFAPEHPAYTGEKLYFDWFEETLITSSTGHAEKRFKIRLVVKLSGRKIRARFTLADRSTQLYPVLIGRNVLRGKFVVDVTLGKALRRTEEERFAKLAAKQQKEGLN